MKIHNISKNREVSHKTSFFMPPVVEGSDGTTVDTLPRLRTGVIFTPLKPGSTQNSNGIHGYYSYLLATEHDVKGTFLSIRPGCPPQPIEQSLSAANRPLKKQKHEEKQDKEKTALVVAAVLLCRARTSESEWQEERDSVEACNHDVASEFLKWASDLVSVCGGYEGWAQDPILQQEGNKNVLPWLRAREFGKVNDLFC